MKKNKVKCLSRLGLQIVVFCLGIILSMIPGLWLLELFEDYVVLNEAIFEGAQSPDLTSKIQKPPERKSIFSSLDGYTINPFKNRLWAEIYKSQPEKYFFAFAQYTTHSPEDEAVTDEHVRIWALLSIQQEELNVCKFRDYYSPDFFLGHRYPNLFELGKDRYLVELYCDIGYNRTLQYFIYESRDIKPLLFERVQWQALDEHNIIVLETEEPSFLGGIRTYDPKEKILQIYGKGSGGAVDGDFSKYQWSEVEQRFILLEYRHKSGYDPPFDPRQYPLIYQR
ncbi:MAG: hypothetical protein F6J87_03655 [Spirulina sp. SIO3F2]|nr:hypothetical protein [Spirulina sp. SIO3F2]